MQIEGKTCTYMVTALLMLCVHNSGGLGSWLMVKFSVISYVVLNVEESNEVVMTIFTKEDSVQHIGNLITQVFACY